MLTTFIETNITNLNFFLLFLTMILYWLKSTLFLSEKYYFLPNRILIMSSVFQTLFLCLRWKISNHFPLSNLYESLLFLSWSLTVALVILNKKLTHTQFIQNLDLKQTLIISTKNEKLINSMFGSILMPLILLLNTFATFSLPLELKTSTALVPALQSNWLLMHVTVMMLSYAALLCGCLFSIAYLILSFLFTSGAKNTAFQGNSIGTNQHEKKIKNFVFNSMSDFAKTNLQPFQNSTSQIAQVLPILPLFPPLPLLPEAPLLRQAQKQRKQGQAPKQGKQGKQRKEQNKKLQQETINKQTEKPSFIYQIQKNNAFFELKTLDNLSYRILGFGFPLLTIGILSGAVWANQTWGSYWSWDPKETWALITWFIFAIYLHTRLSKGWTGQKSALLASFGFIIIWVCYLGVNLMGKGLHSYGFFT
jgi:ABC-type transport system involved in cytochrome c biogenesis permease subunit